MRMFLGGDVMTGRGVDQILAHPGDPRLWEAGVRDAGGYVRLAEQANGPIRRPVDDAWIWGDALAVLDQWGTDIRFVNLETSITAGSQPWPGLTASGTAPAKEVHYRMAPANVGCLSVAGLDAVTLANNHVLDFGSAGLIDTLDSLGRAGIGVTGAGRDAREAARPAIVGEHPRVVVVGVGMVSSGIPPQWSATSDGPGVDVVDEEHSDGVLERVAKVRRDGDIVVVSVHWGSNWGYHVPAAQTAFAHRLVDGGVAVVHGHSSHHPRPVEVYRDRLILYGCGDLIDDYEGIAGYEKYRDDLRLLYLVTVDASSGRLVGLRLVPLRARRMSLGRAGAEDTEFVCRRLNQISTAPPFVTTSDGCLELTGVGR